MRSSSDQSRSNENLKQIILNRNHIFTLGTATETRTRIWSDCNHLEIKKKKKSPLLQLLTTVFNSGNLESSIVQPYGLRHTEVLVQTQP